MSAFQQLMDMGFPEVLVNEAVIMFHGRPLEEMIFWIIDRSKHGCVDSSGLGRTLADSRDTPVDPNLSEHQADTQGTFVKIDATINENGSIASTACSSGDMLAPVPDEAALSLKSADHATSSNSTNEKQSCDTVQNTNIKCLDCGLIMYERDLEFHAVKTLHENFEETSEKVKERTEDEKKEAVKRLEDRIKQRRLESQEKERKEEIEKEKTRRKMGQEISTARAKFEENETQRQMELHRKEKREAELERQRVRAEIERDKEIRRLEKESKLEVKAVKQQDVPISSQSSEIKEHEICRLQMRLSNGEILTQTFNSKETLAAVKVYVDLHRNDGNKPYDLIMNFPKRHFSENDMMRSLNELGLCPSAVIFIKPKN